MVHAKNYETVSTFVKVIQKKLWPLFFQTRRIYLKHFKNSKENTALQLESFNALTLYV